MNNSSPGNRIPSPSTQSSSPSTQSSSPSTQSSSPSTQSSSPSTQSSSLSTQPSSLSENSWRNQILDEFVLNVSRVTLVADPDGLILEEDLLAGIREKGFDVLAFEDPIAFRYVYESKFRSYWDRGMRTELVVALNDDESKFGTLPYDLLQSGHRLSFSLGKIFPGLSNPIVAALDRTHLDILYKSYKEYNPGNLGENGTKDFLLMHIFGIAPALIKKPSDLLRVLLRRHYRNQCVPALLDDRFIQLMRRQSDFKEWPLETIITNREAFFSFLQERWPVFLDKTTSQDDAKGVDETIPRDFEFSGPEGLPFDHDDIRVYIDNLFVEGFLEPIVYEPSNTILNSWVTVGIRTDKEADRTHRIDRLLGNLADELSKKDMRHDDWFRLSRLWAELVALIFDSETMLAESTLEKVEMQRQQIGEVFTDWLATRYAGLSSLPPAPPVMLHHLPRFIARHINAAGENKAAFVLVDGLAMDQWIVIRKELLKKRPEYRFRENAVFAWIPTFTSVSRQAAFAGKSPIYFPNSIGTTGKEESLWKQFWIDHGLSDFEIIYEKGLGDGALDSVMEQITRPKVRVIGLIINKVDDIMHGMTLGAAGMHNQVRQWAGQPFLTNLIDLLLDNGFRVHLSSDHGNTEASGCGRPGENAMADLRGERARIYPDELLLKQIKKRFPDAVEWPPIGLPEGYFPLLAPDKKAFVRETERIVGHGGASLEEVIVPLVQIERKG